MVQSPAVSAGASGPAAPLAAALRARRPPRGISTIDSTPIDSTRRTVFWADDAVQLIDQRLLPARFEVIALRDVSALADAIRAMAVRGAPAIGAAAAYGMALAARAAANAGRRDFAGMRADLGAAGDRLKAARPTASNLSWAVERQVEAFERVAAGARLARGGDAAAEAIAAALLAEAEAIADADVATNRRMGANGAALLPDDATVLHHCNTGALAAVDYGTALGVVRAAHEAGKRIHVIVDETRPRLQGAKLTCWELGRLGIGHTLIVDGAAAWRMAQGGIDAVLVGADRVAANGDAANKIGTYGLAIAAKHHGVPFYVVAPTSTVDLDSRGGDEIVIEERDGDEVTCFDGRPVAPDGTRAFNPAFDVTPSSLITAIVTEEGVVRPPFSAGLRDAVANARARSAAASAGRTEEATAA